MTSSIVGRLARVGVLGAATGARSSAGLAALSATARPSDPAPLAFFAHPVTRALVGSAVVAEAVLDVHPSTPARTAAQGLIPRLVLSAGVALAMSYRDRCRAAATRFTGPLSGAALFEPGAPRAVEPGAVADVVPVVDAGAATEVAIAVGAAAGVAHLGPVARAALAGRLGSDIPGGIVEDVLAISAAVVGAGTVAPDGR